MEQAVKLGPVSVEPLFLATKTRWIDVQVDAALALAKLNDPRAVDVFISFLDRAEKYPKVYSKAVEALGRYGNQQAVIPLQECVRKYSSKSQATAQEALSRLTDRLKLPAAVAVPQQPVCEAVIPVLKSTIADDIRRSGGVVIGSGLDQTLYEGVICRSCGYSKCD